MSDDAPPWLKSMEHGAIGETRARAFLLQRFWVLNRSVDVDGADYLIQRRLTAATFLDREAPRLGVVQVKFIQDGATGIKIPQSYVQGQDDKPYGEFFLLVCSGKEDDQRMFLLSAADIKSTFESKSSETKTGAPKLYFSTSGETLLSKTNFEVARQSLALDKIEQALRQADLGSNRKFLFYSGSVEISPDQIDHDWLLPLDNEWGDIHGEFHKHKKKLRSMMYNLEDILEAAGKIVSSHDPEEAIRIYEDDIAPHIGGGGYRTSLSVTCDAFDDEDFQSTVRMHKARLAKIRELGLEATYFDLIGSFEKEVVRQLPPLLVAGETVMKIKVTYDAVNLRNPSIRVSKAKGPAPQKLVTKSAKGMQTLVVDLNHSRYSLADNSGKAEALVRDDVIKRLWVLRRPFHGSLDRVYLGKDLVAFWEDDE